MPIKRPDATPNSSGKPKGTLASRFEIKSEIRAESKSDTFSKTATTTDDGLTPLQRYLAKQKQESVAGARSATANSRLQPSAAQKFEPSAQRAIDSTAPPEFELSAPKPALNSVYLMWLAETSAERARSWFAAQKKQWQESATRSPLPTPQKFGSASAPIAATPEAENSRSTAARTAVPEASSAGPAATSTFAGVHRATIHDQPLSWTHAEFGVRLAANLIDLVILLSLRYVLRNDIFGAFSSYWPEDQLGSWTGTRMIFFLSLPYYGWFYSRRGASPGKMVMGLKIVDAHTGQYLRPLRAFFRETLGKSISAMTFMIGFLIAAFRLDRKALHDLVFDTVVVRTPVDPYGRV